MARIAIVGTGISGLGAAYLLNPDHEITVYEKAPRIGGHSRTVTVDYAPACGHERRAIPVDTGFIVFNKPNYPNLTGLFTHLGVPSHASDMTFAATIRNGWLEWGARDLDAVFGQRRNLLRPRFARLVRDVMKFNAGAETIVERHPDFNLDQLIAAMGLGDWFRRYYLLPMAGAIWSCPPSSMMQFPAKSLVRFFANHHLLSASGQPQWRTVTGGAQEYVTRLTRGFAGRIRTNCGVAQISRPSHGKENGKIQIRDTQGGFETYDQLVLACHGDEALALLADAGADERSALSAFRYQKNVAVLHRDVSQMPKRKRCWASWVYRSDGDFLSPSISVTYWMNLLQGIDPNYPLFVSLNPKQPIAPELVFDRTEFDHPVFDAAAIAAQDRLKALQGQRATWFCGAHLRHGFHEDGLWSAVSVAGRLGARIPWDGQPVYDAAQRKYPKAVGFPAPGPTPLPAAS